MDNQNIISLMNQMRAAAIEEFRKEELDEIEHKQARNKAKKEKADKILLILKETLVALDFPDFLLPYLSLEDPNSPAKLALPNATTIHISFKFDENRIRSTISDVDVYYNLFNYIGVDDDGNPERCFVRTRFNPQTTWNQKIEIAMRQYERTETIFNEHLKQQTEKESQPQKPEDQKAKSPAHYFHTLKHQANLNEQFLSEFETNVTYGLLAIAEAIHLLADITEASE